MRVPRDINGKEINTTSYIRLWWDLPTLGEKINQEGYVTYNPIEDQFYLDEHPLEIFDTFEIIKL